MSTNHETRVCVVCMNRIKPFAELINAFPIQEHTVRFNTIGDEWQQLFGQYEELPAIFDSIQNQEGVYTISRADIFAETNTRQKIILTLIWGFPNGYRGKHTLYKIMANMGRITNILGHLNPRYTQRQMCELFRELTAIPGLGFSTVTKLLYFFNVRVGNHKAVIVDSNVLKAIPKINEMKHCPFDCSPESYYQQVGYINRISDRLGIDSPDKLEYFLFNFGKSIK